MFQGERKGHKRGWHLAALRWPAVTHPVYVGLIDDWWHHGQTAEVYQWLFPRLGLRQFEPYTSLRDLMPEEIAYPSVARLADRMIDELENSRTDVSYALLMSFASSRTLLRNSDAAMKRGTGKHDEYRAHHVIHHSEVDDDVIYFIPVTTDARADALTLVGKVSTGRYQAMRWADAVEFDPSTL